MTYTLSLHDALPISDPDAHIGSHTCLQHDQSCLARLEFRCRCDTRQVGNVQDLRTDVIRTPDLVPPLAVVTPPTISSPLSIRIPYHLSPHTPPHLNSTVTVT